MTPLPDDLCEADQIDMLLFLLNKHQQPSVLVLTKDGFTPTWHLLRDFLAARLKVVLAKRKAVA